jgi:hypothetical protein
MALMAYVLLCALRHSRLHHTDFAEATCNTIRLKFLKISALVGVSVRRIKIARPRPTRQRKPGSWQQLASRPAAAARTPRGSTSQSKTDAHNRRKSQNSPRASRQKKCAPWQMDTTPFIRDFLILQTFAKWRLD